VALTVLRLEIEIEIESKSLNVDEGRFKSPLGSFLDTAVDFSSSIQEREESLSMPQVSCTTAFRQHHHQAEDLLSFVVLEQTESFNPWLSRILTAAEGNHG
jgi:hypothetical protein